MSQPGTPSPGMNSLRQPGSLLRLARGTLRTQLALLYAAVFVVLGAVLLAVSGLLVRSSSVGIGGVHNSQSVLAGRQFNIGPALAFAAAVLVALALGWFIAGRFVRPLRMTTATAEGSARQR
jgi:hypothetical protein